MSIKIFTKLPPSIAELAKDKKHFILALKRFFGTLCQLVSDIWLAIVLYNHVFIVL
jgi:hypothetical protein